MKIPKILLKSRGPIIAADALIINKKKQILLTRRNIKPFKDFWVLPGGHIKYGEQVEPAVIREVSEETGYQIKIKKIHGVYSAPNRDPRYHIIAIVFIAEIIGGEPEANREVTDINFFSRTKLPKKIGFDHRKIINDYIKHESKR